MNFNSWYTDKMTVYRVDHTKVGNLTKNARVMVYEDIPCRVYQDAPTTPTMKQDAASIRQASSVALDNKWVILPGDELIISRGGLIGHSGITSRAFAGDPHHHFEPFGGVVPFLSHQEIKLLQEERL